MRTRTLVVIISGIFFCGLYIYGNLVSPQKKTIHLQIKDKQHPNQGQDSKQESE